MTDAYTKTHPYACMSVLDLSAPQRLKITDCNPPVTIPWATPGIKINRHNSQKSVTQIGFQQTIYNSETNMKTDLRGCKKGKLRQEQVIAIK